MTLCALAKYTKINDSAFLRDYHRTIILPRLSQTLVPDRAAIEFILDVERKRNPAVAKFKAESFYDSTFIEEAAQGRVLNRPCTELNRAARMTSAGIGAEPGIEKNCHDSKV